MSPPCTPPASPGIVRSRCRQHQPDHSVGQTNLNMILIRSPAEQTSSSASTSQVRLQQSSKYNFISVPSALKSSSSPSLSPALPPAHQVSRTQCTWCRPQTKVEEGRPASWNCCQVGTAGCNLLLLPPTLDPPACPPPPVQDLQQDLEGPHHLGGCQGCLPDPTPPLRPLC